MIQELLGGGGGSNPLGSYGGGERKISISNILENPSPSSSTTTTTPTTSSTPENPNLRCPRCDSSNTKFCYYNNYNLTQPRHFCKTCRRYWTKGGALRNVPIGGGCRKNKGGTTACSGIMPPTSGGKAAVSSGKLMKTVLSSCENGTHDLSSTNPILWGPPQTSHLLALLRSTQNPNPNPNHISNSCLVKEEGLMMGSTSHLGSDQVAAGRTLGLDPSFWRNNQFQGLQQQQQNGFILGEVQNNGIPDLYQRLRSSSANYYPDHTPLILGNVANSVSATSSAILDSAPVPTGAELGYWNPSLAWSDLQTANGAYH